MLPTILILILIPGILYPGIRESATHLLHLILLNIIQNIFIFIMIFLSAKLDIIKGMHKLKGTVQDANIFLKTLFADCYYKKKSLNTNLEKPPLRLQSTVSVYPSYHLPEFIQPIKHTLQSLAVPQKVLGSCWKTCLFSPDLLRLLSCTHPSFYKRSTPLAT